MVDCRRLRRLIVGFFGLSMLTFIRWHRPIQVEEVGRFVIVSTTTGGIVVLDNATGELYRAGKDDIKPYSTRPRLDRDWH